MLKKFARQICLIIAIVIFVGNIPVMADSNINVYLNEEKLTFQDAQPTIINDRVMVPIREIAEYLGMTCQWSDETSTMTFTRDNRSMIHTINTSFILVDGEMQTFDASSTIAGGRTLMPVRMLGEAIGAEVSWEGSSRTVSITSVGEPEIYTVSSSSNTIAIGQNVTIEITANEATSSVRLMDNNYTNLAESNIYTDSNGTRTFIINYMPSETPASNLISVLPGDGSVYSTANGKSITLNIAANLEITSAYANDTSLEKGDKTFVTIYTNESVTRVKLENDYNNDVLEQTYYTDYSAGQRSFEFTIVMPSDDDDVKYTAYAGSSSGYSSSVTKSLTIYQGNSADYPEIIDYDISDNYFSDGDEIEVTITTNTAVEYIEIWDADDNEVESASSPDDEDDDEYYWELYFYPDEEGTFTIYAYGEDDDDYDTQTFRLRYND